MIFLVTILLSCCLHYAFNLAKSKILSSGEELYPFFTKHCSLINPFPHDKILGLTKSKAFADDKLNVTKMVISVFDRVENIVGKGEIACTSNFSFSHNVFKRLLSQTHQKVSSCWNELTQCISFPDKVV